MAFKSREENGGEIDPRVNVKGRPKGSGKKLNRREIYDKEMIYLARKIKPHWSKALMEVVKLLHKEEVSDQNKIKAAVVIDNAYRSILKEVYDVEAIGEVEEVQPQNPEVLLSLTVVDQNKTGTDD